MISRNHLENPKPFIFPKTKEVRKSTSTNTSI